MSDIRNVNDSNFETEVKAVTDKPVFVDFWAPWCGPCRMVAPLMEEAADTYDGKIIVAKYNVDESNGVAADNGIRGIPTIPRHTKRRSRGGSTSGRCPARSLRPSSSSTANPLFWPALTPAFPFLQQNASFRA